MMLAEALLVVQKVTQEFERLGVAYFIGGSFASALYGLPRATRDVDFIADLKKEQVDSLVAALETEFYLDAKTIRSAILHQRSFNIIHLETMFKADIFVLATNKWSQNQFQRRVLKPMQAETSGPTVWTCTAEDIVLQKLLWFDKGGRISRQQWDDVLGVIKLHHPAMNFDYLKQWSIEIGIPQLLELAITDAGIEKETL
ncbi:MAG: hypothetical protein JNM09_13870 [Blastocatellia bacterium]|nr:hypothetical protein [Blastocatellia bacterium]